MFSRYLTHHRAMAANSFPRVLRKSSQRKLTQYAGGRPNLREGTMAIKLVDSIPRSWVSSSNVGTTAKRGHMAGNGVVGVATAKRRSSSTRSEPALGWKALPFEQ